MVSQAICAILAMALCSSAIFWSIVVMTADVTPNPGPSRDSMKQSAALLAVLFSSLAFITFLINILKKYKRRRARIPRQPARESEYEPAERCHKPDFTLLMTGGLYDGPEIYNPAILEEDDNESFNPSPRKFRLEILPPV